MITPISVIVNDKMPESVKLDYLTSDETDNIPSADVK